MASYYEEAGEESFSDFSDTDTDAPSDSQSSSDSDPAPSGTQQQVCQYYNDGHCRYGRKCRDLHVCKYSLKGTCRYGAACRLKHIRGSDLSAGNNERGRKSHGKKRRGHRKRSSSSSSDDSGGWSGKPYRWQLDLGNGWEDVAHDHILEAQYSRPNTKGIRIYNTPCGALSIDFTKMRILKKTNLRVRRKGSRQTEWLWHYRGNQGWHQYGEKDSQGKASPVSSSTLEKEFQKNRQGVVQFSIDSTNYEIRFKDMCQKNLSTGHRRRIRRRPKYESPSGRGIKTLTKAFTNLTSSLQRRHHCGSMVVRVGAGTVSHIEVPAVSSADIEAAYQCNPQGSINFTVNGDPYTIDFSKMTQTNLKTNTTRKVQRV
ncbi:LOW QUALITY PROTEIN: protein mono-ADP-ribosyltransferase PARP12 [Colossoma macropomum]|uniref:LOW QUALITY PROTEIN: protein mono-ADP-ribosyltransferase PARP12 n=1 Tax=Colossoma macropomum TaxID=42526 RepID=UPI001864A2B8|nr:LOW QUALITY PROTEIN: protein mono-ADP-ribosyltransferase PARP12 [Colossoma macropomum]